MQRTATLFLILSLFSGFLAAQIPVAGDTLYGNEWIEPGGVYLRIEVTADGLYRVDPAAIAAAGLPANENDGERYRLYSMGRTVPIDISTEGVAFYGRRARAELDTLMYRNGAADVLNTRYSLVTDTAAYYLTVVPGVGADERFTPGSPGSGGNVTNTVYRSAEKVFSDNYSKYYSRSNGSTIIFSHYELAEGFGLRGNSELLSSNGSTISAAEVNLPGAVSGAAELTVRFGLAFGNEHRQRISVNGEVKEEFTSEDWSVNEQRYPFQSSGTKAALRMEGLAGDQDKANIAFVTVDYPARAELSGQQLPFYLPGGQEFTLNFSTLPAGARLYDLTDGKIYTPNANSILLPAADHRREFILASGALTPAATATVDLADQLPPAQTEYLIVSSRRLAGAGLEALADYRRSPLGGGYGVHRVYIEDIYESFGYGLRRHPQALRNYLEASMKRSDGLRFLFIVGKGREYPDLRTDAGLAAAWSTFFVPSFGYPASDNQLSARIGTFVPRLATGRLSAITPDEISIYTTKLQAVERQVNLAGQTIEDLDWMKQALFLGGGQSPTEQATIRYNLGTMERIFENSKFGGNVTNVYRTSTDPIEEARTNTIFDRINAGTSVITFYGHSSSQGFDFNIDNPENYENLNRYPFMMSLGCYSGDAFTQARSISERFLFLPDGGAITYAASKGLGYISALGTFGRSVFRHLGTDQYGAGIGEVLNAAIADFSGTKNFTLGILLEQFSLSGDPAFRFHPRPGPDLVIDPASVAFEPTVIPAQDTSFGLRLRLMNLGIRPEGLPDSVALSFRQELPSGEIRELGRQSLYLPFYDEEFEITLPNVGFEAVGINRLLVTVDPDDEIAELPAPAAESNNTLIIGGQAGVPFTVVANTAKAAFPPDYAMIGPDVELVAGTSNPLADERDYRIQIATRSDFAENLIDRVITAPGGIIRYRPEISFSDSTTYYWRVSPDSSSNGSQGYLWDGSSFTVLMDQEPEAVDFAVQHSGQFLEGDVENLRLRVNEPDWNYTRTVNDVEIFNGIYEGRSMPRLVLNGNRLNSPHPWKVFTGVQVLLIDSIRTSKWYPNLGDGEYNTPPGRSSPWCFDTRTDAGRQGLIRFLDEYVQEGMYALVYSVQRGNDLEYHNDGWLADSTTVGRTIYGMLEEQGAEQTRLLQSLGSVPYVFAYQKGFGPIAESIATSQDAETYTLIPVEENWEEGNYTSPAAGPALEWSSLRISFSGAEIGTADSCLFSLVGVDYAGRETEVLQQGLDIRGQRSFTFDLSSYDAATYPYFKASFSLFDEEDRTAATVRGIYFDYRRPGDVAISPAVALDLPEVIDQGQEIVFEVGYENLTPTPMDSLLVELSIFDEQNEATTLTSRQPPLEAKGSGSVRFTLPTQELSTNLRMQMRLNPDRDQPEDIIFNNVMNAQIGVGTDFVAPDLKVYYDGRTIRNGELVSAKPEILIRLRDENPNRRLDDSTAFYLRVSYPDGTERTIPLSDEQVEFIPAKADGDNMAEVYFRPELEQDGIHSLTVQATDRAKNRSGALDYEQQFEVVNQQLISNVLTYPNPFTSQTSFVYTLTGSTPPDMFRIQIMTVSGRVVRDIDLLANEAISIGTHQTDYKWDGTDEYGDLLANGVYLYRVITSDAEGETLEKRDTGTDQYFQNGFGKVVILR